MALDAALAQVDGAADDKWKVDADYAISRLATRQETITADDVWDVLDDLGSGDPPEKRAIGPRFNAAARDGIIERTERTRKSRHPSRHKGDVRVWRSLIFWEDR